MDGATGFGRSRAESEVKTVVTTAPMSKEGGGERNRSLWDELGVPEPPFLDESRAPSVDRDCIRQMVRRELPEPRAKEVSRLVVLFKSWSDVHLEVLREETRRRHPKNMRHCSPG